MVASKKRNTKIQKIHYNQKRKQKKHNVAMLLSFSRNLMVLCQKFPSWR